MLRATFLAVLALALGGCPEGASITCPTLKEYSAAFLAKAERELDAIERIAPSVVEIVNDYGVDRDAIRKCIALRKKG